MRACSRLQTKLLEKYIIRNQREVCLFTRRLQYDILIKNYQVKKI